MARISTYVRDQDIHGDDILLGSEFAGYNVNGFPEYRTKNYRMYDLKNYIELRHYIGHNPIIIVQPVDAPLGDLEWYHAEKTPLVVSSSASLLHHDYFTAINSITIDDWGHIDGYNTATYRLPEEYYFNITGDAINWSGVASVSQRIDTTNTVNVNGGDNWISTQSLNTDTVKIFHNDVDRNDPDVVPAAQLGHSGTFNVITSVTSDIKGHVTAVAETQYTLPDIYSFDITADIPGAYNKEIIDGETLSILGGDILTSTVTADNTITIDHNPVTHTPTDAGPVTLSYGGEFTALTARTVSGEGHLIASTKTTYTLPSAYGFTVTGDDNVVQTITDGNTLDIVGVAPISTSSTTTDTVSITHDNVPRSVETSTITAQPAFGGTFTSLISVTSDAKGHTTASNLKTITIPNSIFTTSAPGLVPTSTGTTLFLRGDATWATLPADNNTTYGISAANNGKIRLTDSSGTTDDVTIAGGTGISIGTSGDTITVTNTGVTSNIASTGISVSSATGAVTITNTAPDQTVLLAQGGATTITGAYPSFTISSTNTLPSNGVTEVTAGGGITLGGDITWSADQAAASTFSISHTDTSTQASVNNSGRTYIQDITLDDYGHITGIASATETVVNTDTNTTYTAGTGMSLSGTTFNCTIVNTDTDTVTSVGANNTGLSTGNIYINGAGATSISKSGGTITISSTDTNTNTTYTAGTGMSLSGTVFNCTVVNTDTVYTHPAYTARSINTSGALVLGGFTSDATGHVTNITTRTLTLANLGGISSEVDTLATVVDRGNNTNNSANGRQIGIGTAVRILGTTITNRSSIDFLGNGRILSWDNGGGGGGTIEIGSNFKNGAVTEDSRVGIGFAGKYRIEDGHHYFYGAGYSNNTGTGISWFNNATFWNSGAVEFLRGSVTSINFITTSDRRLKSDIKPIKDGLSVLKQFTSYEYIKDEKQDAGFIAQEVKEVIPYSVFENSEGYLSMNDRPILAHMHKAILELEARLIAIEEKLK